jgi:hypothetical protein
MPATMPPAIESFRRINPVLTVLHTVDPVAIVTKHHGVNIDLKSRTIRQNKRVGRFAAENRITPAIQNRLQPWDV